MFTTNQIQQLLDKYFAGQTSLKEEALLQQYFNQEEVAESLQQYQALFQFFKLEKTIQLEKEKTMAIASKDPVRSIKKSKIRYLYHPIARIAAALLLVVIAYWTLSPKVAVQQQTINWEQYEITDEQEAMEKTLAALELLSKKFSHSSKKASKGVKKIKAINIFNEK